MRSLILGVLLASFAGGAVHASDASDCIDKSGDDAIAACTRAIQDPGASADRLSASYAARSFHYTGENQFEKALSDINNAIKINSNVAFYYNNRSNAERSLGDYEAAFSDANEALKQDPNDLPAHLNRGLVFLLRQKFPEAIDDFSLYIARNPDDAESFTFRGMAFRDNNQIDLAMADFATAIKINTDGTRPYEYRAALFLTLNKYDDAISDYARVLSVSPNDAVCLYGLGLAKTRSGRDGQNDLDRARAIDPNIESDFAGATK